MVSSISSGLSITMPTTSSSSSAAKLTTEQKTLISDTLSELDAENLTEADALSIIETFSEAGIEPGKEMESALADLGFDAKQIGDLANVEGGDRPAPPPPPSQSEDEIASMATYLEELLAETLEASDSTELTDEQRDSIYAQVMEKFGIEEGDSIINTSA
jgi:hypothetical protein